MAVHLKWEKNIEKKSLIIISVLKIIPLLMIIISLVINVFMEGFLSTFITRPM